jgi:hypothetical protein
MTISPACAGVQHVAVRWRGRRPDDVEPGRPSLREGACQEGPKGSGTEIRSSSEQWPAGQNPATVWQTPGDERRVVRQEGPTDGLRPLAAGMALESHGGQREQGHEEGCGGHTHWLEPASTRDGARPPPARPRESRIPGARGQEQGCGKAGTRQASKRNARPAGRASVVVRWSLLCGDDVVCGKKDARCGRRGRTDILRNSPRTLNPCSLPLPCQVIRVH